MTVNKWTHLNLAEEDSRDSRRGTNAGSETAGHYAPGEAQDGRGFAPSPQEAHCRSGTFPDTDQLETPRV